MRRNPILRLLAVPAFCAYVATLFVTPTFGNFPGGAYGPGHPEPGILYFHHSHVNNASLVTDVNGIKVSCVEYEPFGKINQSSSNGVDNFRYKFNGKEYDTDSELYYFNARYYDPDIQRFITPDISIGAHPMHHSSLHRYAFAGNNPISYTDPSGHFAIFAFAISLAVAIGVGALVAGTQGKIFPTPVTPLTISIGRRHWFGGIAGGVLHLMSFGLSSLGSAGFGGATLWGTPIKQYIQKSLSSAVIGTIQSWSQGVRDPGRLGAYFGASFVTGMIASSGYFGLTNSEATSGFGGAIAEQMATSFNNSLVKKIVDPSNPIEISAWAFNVSFGSEVKFKADWAFVAGQGVAFLSNLSEGGFDKVKENFDFNTMTLTTKGSKLEFAFGFLPKNNGYVHDIMMSAAYTMDNGLLDYAANSASSKLFDTFGVDPGGPAGGIINKGVDDLAQKLGPDEAFWGGK